MDKNNKGCTSGCGYVDREIDWGCKICKDLPNYAGMYLWQREDEKNKILNKDEEYVDILMIKYYYALLHLLDEIHKRPECPKQKHLRLNSSDQRCKSPEYFDYYQKIYYIYAKLLVVKGIEEGKMKCDICAILPYTLFSDLELVAKNMCSEDIKKTQKLELEAVVTDWYLNKFGSCDRWKECPNSNDWLELMYGTKILQEYLKTKDREMLNIALSLWNKTRATDNILNIGIKITSKDFQTQDISLCELEGKTLVYLDFGVYQVYESDEIFSIQLDNYAEMNEIQFVYSPTHMEEVCRMCNFVFESKRRANISKICGDYEILPIQDGSLKIVIESVDICFSRAKKHRILNENAEEYECAKFEALEEQTCRLLRWDEKTFNKYKIKISSLTSLKLFDPQDKTIDNKILNQVFVRICGSSVPIEEFKDYSKKAKTFFEIREAISLLYMLMNALGYHKNKIEKRTQFTHEALYPTYDRKFFRTIRSGFYDVDHLCYASKCDYFVTCDHVLSLQAREIYSYLGYKTHVIYCKK